MKLDIDFSPTSPKAPKRSFVLMAGACLALVATAWNAAVMFDEVSRTKERIKMAFPHEPSRETALSLAQIESINRAIRQLNLPWDSLFGEIETRLNSRIALLSLEPEASRRVLRIQGEAKTPEDMLDFIASLEGPESFRKVTLTRHEINEADPNRPIRFLAEALWDSE